MTEDRLPLADLLAKARDGDFLRSVAEAVLQMLMESDVEGLIRAGRHERTGEWLNYRNGFRDRALDTRLGSLQFRIPKLRQGSYYRPFLEPRKTSGKALVAVIQEAWTGGVSTGRVDDLLHANGRVRHLEVDRLEALQGYRRAGRRLLGSAAVREWP
jgi:transposase-like protein